MVASEHDDPEEVIASIRGDDLLLWSLALDAYVEQYQDDLVNDRERFGSLGELRDAFRLLADLEAAQARLNALLADTEP